MQYVPVISSHLANLPYTYYVHRDIVFQTTTRESCLLRTINDQPSQKSPREQLNLDLEIEL